MNKRNFKRIWSTSFAIFLGLALAITYFFLLYQKDVLLSGISTLLSILRPFFIGIVLAYIMKSTCNLYERTFTRQLLRSKKRDENKSRKIAAALAVVLTYVTWLALLSALLWIVIPQIVGSITKFINDMVAIIPTWVDKIFEFEQKFLENNEMLRPYLDSIVSKLITWSETELIPQLSEIGASIIPALLNIFTIIKDIVIGLVISTFFLAGRKMFGEKFKLIIRALFKKETSKAIISEFKYADKMFSGFLEGKVIDSAIVGLAYYIFLIATDIPYPALIAVICGVTNIIPFFGPFIGAIPSGLIILMTAENPIKVLWFAIFVCVAQFIDGYIVDPHIVGGNIKLSSFNVLFAVLVFGGLFGFWGLLIGVPTFAVIHDIAKKLVYSFLKKKNKLHLLDRYFAKTGQTANYQKTSTKEAENEKSAEEKAEEKNEEKSNAPIPPEDYAE